MEQRLIDANEPYEKIQSLIEDLKPRGRLEYIRGLEEALDIIEFSKTVEWGGRKMPARNHQNRKSCEGCRYFRNLAIGRSYCVCHYMLDTGQSRGCEPTNCTKYTPLNPREKLVKSFLEEQEESK